MTTSFCETALVKRALTAAVMTLKFAILVLVVISLYEAFEMISNVIYDIRQKNDLISFGVLTAVLMPAGGVLFWGCRAILMSFEEPSRTIHRYFQRQRDKKSPMREGADPKIAVRLPPHGSS